MRSHAIASPQPSSIIPGSGPAEQIAERVLGVIPARLGSTRLARKVLREIAGRPLLAWVVEASLRCPQLSRVVVATDAEEVAALCREHGWAVELTSPDLPSGTDRMHAIAQRPGYDDYDLYVNLQGDEPLLRPEHLSALLRPFSREGVEVTTLKVRCSPENVDNPHAVKVVTASDGRALYFSRASIPYDRDSSGTATYWKHLGLYAYRRAALARFPALATSPLEQAERLEQLRLLENGMHIQVEETAFDTVGVDSEQDLHRVAALLSARGLASGE